MKTEAILERRRKKGGDTLNQHSIILRTRNNLGGRGDCLGEGGGAAGVINTWRKNRGENRDTGWGGWGNVKRGDSLVGGGKKTIDRDQTT